MDVIKEMIGTSLMDAEPRPADKIVMMDGQGNALLIDHPVASLVNFVDTGGDSKAIRGGRSVTGLSVVGRSVTDLKSVWALTAASGQVSSTVPHFRPRSASEAIVDARDTTVVDLPRGGRLEIDRTGAFLVPPGHQTFAESFFGPNQFEQAEALVAQVLTFNAPAVGGRPGFQVQVFASNPSGRQGAEPSASSPLHVAVFLRNANGTLKKEGLYFPAQIQTDTRRMTRGPQNSEEYDMGGILSLSPIVPTDEQGNSFPAFEGLQLHIEYETDPNTGEVKTFIAAYSVDVSSGEGSSGQRTVTPFDLSTGWIDLDRRQSPREFGFANIDGWRLSF